MLKWRGSPCLIPGLGPFPLGKYSILFFHHTQDETNMEIIRLCLGTKKFLIFFQVQWKIDWFQPLPEILSIGTAFPAGHQVPLVLCYMFTSAGNFWEFGAFGFMLVIVSIVLPCFLIPICADIPQCPSELLGAPICFNAPWKCLIDLEYPFSSHWH